MPPPELRRFVGPLADADYDNPTGALVFPDLPASAYERVLDFGCGCGRVARQLIQQSPRPKEYVGVDLHRRLIDWCVANLQPHAPGFRFLHHDVFNESFNKGWRKPRFRPLPDIKGGYTLAIAHSVFTHILEPEIPRYLQECARVLAPGGLLRATWFLFDKGSFPMMQDDQNTLYINLDDPTNAVIVDRAWLLRETTKAGLRVVRVEPPALRGFHWTLWMAKDSSGAPHVPIGEDVAPIGRMPPPRLD